MPTQMIGRPILRKQVRLLIGNGSSSGRKLIVQTNYRFYRPSAIAVANTLADIPFSASRIFLYNIVVYFLSGLHRSAGGFFTFHLFNYLAYLVMQGFFRTFGHLCSDFDTAFRLAVFFIPNL
jgi:ATP-binding cassette subfamily G (WHITE) protein 2 (SNQ2)